jgi:hypothetical protein
VKAVCVYIPQPVQYNAACGRCRQEACNSPYMGNGRCSACNQLGWYMSHISGVCIQHAPMCTYHSVGIVLDVGCRFQMSGWWLQAALPAQHPQAA